MTLKYIKSRLTGRSIHNSLIYKGTESARSIRRVVCAVSTWKEQGCTIIYDRVQITAVKNTFLGRIQLNGHATYDRIIWDLLKELI
jgi:hypothetical protein